MKTKEYYGDRGFEKYIITTRRWKGEMGSDGKAVDGESIVVFGFEKHGRDVMWIINYPYHFFLFFYVEKYFSILTVCYIVLYISKLIFMFFLRFKFFFQWLRFLYVM